MRYWRWILPPDAVPTNFLSLSAWNTSAIIRRLPDKHRSSQSPPLHHTRQSVLPAEYPAFRGIGGSALPGLPNLARETAPGRSSPLPDALFFDFLSFLLFFGTVFVLDSPAATPHLWQGTLQADASLGTARRFPESLADYNLESILFLMGRNSYHYPPPMLLAKDLRKSIHSYKESLRMRTGTDSFLTN